MMTASNDPRDLQRPEERSARAFHPGGWRESAAVGGLLGLVIVLPLLLPSGEMLRRGFWLDELVTLQIVADPDWRHAIDAVRHGVDTNVPAFHVILRTIWGAVKFFADAARPEWVFRTASLAVTWAGLLLLYRLLRSSFRLEASVVGVLLVGCQYLLQNFAIEARSYAFSFTAAAALCVAMSGNGWPSRMSTFVFAAMLSTLHYFGILTVGLLVLGHLVCGHGTRRQRALRGVAALGGSLALVPFLPWMALQAEGVSVRTWIPQSGATEIARFLGGLVSAWTATLLVAAAGIVGMVGKRRHAGADDSDRPAAVRAASDVRLDGRRWVPASMLLLAPLVLVGFSLVVQPVTVSRYIITSLVALGPFGAWCVRDLSPRWTWCVVAMLVLLSCNTAVTIRGWKSVAEDRRIALASRLAAYPEGTTIVFCQRGEAQELTHAVPQLHARSRILLPEFRDARFGDLRQFEFDTTKKVVRFYSIPAPVLPSQLPDSDSILIVGAMSDLRLWHPYLAGKRYGWFAIDDWKSPPSSDAVAAELRRGPWLKRSSSSRNQ